MSVVTDGADTPLVLRSAMSDHRVAENAHYARAEMHAGNAIDGNRATYWESWPDSQIKKAAFFLLADRIETPPGTKLVVRLISQSHSRHQSRAFSPLLDE